MKRLSLYIGLIAALFLTGCAPQNGETPLPARHEPPGETSETPSDAAKTPAADTALPFAAQYIRTDGYDAERQYPVITVITSRDELSTYYEDNKDAYDLQSRESVASDQTMGFLDAMQAYDGAFFEDKCLVLVVVEEPSGSNRHEVTDAILKDGVVDISIKRNVPEIGTSDMAQWHIFVELPASAAGREVSVSLAAPGSTEKKRQKDPRQYQ